MKCIYANKVGRVHIKHSPLWVEQEFHYQNHPTPHLKKRQKLKLKSEVKKKKKKNENIFKTRYAFGK